MTTNVVARSEISEQHKWNAPSVFATVADWEAAFENVKTEVPKLKDFAGKLQESSKNLVTFFQMREGIERRVMKLFMYAAFAYNCDTNDEEAAGLESRVRALFGNYNATVAFAPPEILAIGQDKINQWLDSNEELAVYRHSFDDLFRQQANIRSADVEEVLGMLSDPFGSVENTYSLLTNADFAFAPAKDAEDSEHDVAQSNIEALLTSNDRDVRRSAWEHYMDTYVAHRNALTSNYLTAVKQNIFMAQVRGYESVLHMKMAPKNISVEVFHNLIETYKKHLPTWHRYWRIRRQMLGVDQLHTYDIWAPLTANPPRVPYQQAVDWIVAGLQPLGDEYVGALQRGALEERWVDVYPNQGKRAGAFSWGTYDTYPFIMMSYTDDLNSMSTLAHELGHSMHSYLTNRHQPYVYSHYSLFVAEVASNFNQAMTRAALFATEPDAHFQIALIEEAMRNFHRYFFIMPTLARFEYEVHTRVQDGQSQTAKDLIDLMVGLFSEGYGAEMIIDRERIGMTWATFGHLYEAFYTFQYATGISGAHAFSQAILEGEVDAVDRYLGFLKSGSSDYPLNVLKAAGVDLTVPDAVEATFAVLGSLIDRLESLANTQ